VGLGNEKSIGAKDSTPYESVYQKILRKIFVKYDRFKYILSLRKRFI
jgi:hypothetical protein